MLFFCFCIFIACEQPTQIQLYISEFMSQNTMTHATDKGEYFDWIEIHNAGAKPINLDGFTLSDNQKKPDKWTFPYVVLAPDERLLVYASHENRTDPSTDLHTNFRISSDAEILSLVNNLGVVVDQLAIEHLSPNHSIGVSPIS